MQDERSPEMLEINTKTWEKLIHDFTRSSAAC
jgi:hypothetical protein